MLEKNVWNSYLLKDGSYGNMPHSKGCIVRPWFRRFAPSTFTVIGLLLTIIVWEVSELNPLFLQRIELLAADLRFQLRGPKPAGSEVVIAAIDEKSIDRIGRWPWSYRVQARLVDRLTAYGAAAIGYDVVFSSADTTVGGDVLATIREIVANSGDRNAADTDAVLQRAIIEANEGRFADALRRSDRAILGYFFHFNEKEVEHLSPKAQIRFLLNISNSKYNAPITAPGVHLRAVKLPSAWDVESSLQSLSEAAWGQGFFNSVPDIDGVTRRYRLIVKYRNLVEIPVHLGQDYLFAPLGIRLLERYLQDGNKRATTLFWIDPEGVTRVGIYGGKKNFKIPTDRQGQMLINHLGPSTPDPLFVHYSVVDILAGQAPPEAFRNKIVIVGATATGLRDLRATPFDTNFPGVEFHATVVDNILHKDFLVEPSWSRAYAVWSIFLLGILLTVLLSRLRALWSGLATGLALLVPIVLNYLLFARLGLWLNMINPLSTTVVVSGGLMLFKVMIEERDKRFLRKTFNTYLSPVLIERMVQDRTEPRLGGVSGIHTAYFTDIASFSSFSEVLSATQLVELLNEYLSAMTDTLLAEGGTLDKYEGDAILAFFGAPIPMADHATRALRTALEMQRVLAQLREKWASEGDKWPDLVKQMRMRIGINSGEFVTGNMGSTTRMDYTMMGDVVNTAARLESSAKQYGIYIMCTTDTLTMAGAEAFEWRAIDIVRVVGKVEPVDSVEIMGYKGQLSEDQVLMRDIYHQGIELYRQQKWDAAIAKFAQSEKLEAVFAMRPTNPSRVYLERCELFKATPPGEDWDGTWTMTSK